MSAPTRRYHPEKIAELDADITVAYLDVLEARDRWAHSPNSDTCKAEQEAVELMDGLLKLRHEMDPHELDPATLMRLGFDARGECE